MYTIELWNALSARCIADLYGSNPLKPATTTVVNELKLVTRIDEKRMNKEALFAHAIRFNTD
jgi:hypothetical protein